MLSESSRCAHEIAQFSTSWCARKPLSDSSFAEDMAALAIAFTVNCHEELDEEVINSLDVNSWLFVGGFADLMISCFVCMKSLSSRRFYMKLWSAMDPLTCCFLMLIMLFDIIWTVFGFMFWAEMTAGSSIKSCASIWCEYNGELD